MVTTEFDFIVDNEHSRRSDAELFFGQTPEEVFWLDESKDLWDILVICGLFPSRSQARKNGRAKEIPSGWTDQRMGKLKHRICILNVQERISEDSDI